MDLRDDDDMLEEFGTWTGYANGPVYATPRSPGGWQLLSMSGPSTLVTQLIGLVRRIEPAPVRSSVRS